MSRKTKVATHAAYKAAQQQGLLRNGRPRVGQTLGQRRCKAEVQRRACRGRVTDQQIGDQ